MTGFHADNIRDLQRAYRVLHADITASPEEIRATYRTLVRQWHPDRWSFDPDKLQRATRKMQDINAAYDLVRTAPLRHNRPEYTTRRPSGTKTHGNRPSREDLYRQRWASRCGSAAKNAYGRDPQEAAAFRRREGARFRFCLGFTGGLLFGFCLLTYLGWSGVPFFAGMITLALVCGWLLFLRNTVEQRRSRLFGGVFSAAEIIWGFLIW